ncbi:glyoxylase-like metal-dependent hydrolase (beta-lactamase superfamily II) [Natronocella acetinitrilica]|uniref:Glyoxylase-like metal-dependent hydrolase (Beta-lactamase superfamily II) n=1 Tax=Natronocella acetinitrilica TaxID=414046 RepID=A0AAE3G4Z6_9GAMM|nr:MBL fold metallo-hydrolase [Natronocella acetinitrilica]MCP1674846.1 glyoxylase-like metal-dependent hydrolase (beta-lactamase superfamily II) [Natronocella acetinitrilica]
MSVTYTTLLQGNNVRLQGGFLGLSSVVLVEAGGLRILVDTGHHVTRHMLLDALKVRGLSPADIDVVFLTHLHFDHANNVDLFESARIMVSQTEWDYAHRPHAEDQLVPCGVTRILSDMNVDIFTGEPEICPGVQALATPGHTPGHMSLVLRTEDKGTVVIAGDAIKYPKETLTGRCDMAFDRVERGTASIARIMQIADRIIPGHFPEIYKVGDNRYAWDEGAEFNLVIR